MYANLEDLRYDCTLGRRLTDEEFDQLLADLKEELEEAQRCCDEFDDPDDNWLRDLHDCEDDLMYWNDFRDGVSYNDMDAQDL